jgi:hypothetical protein
MCESSACDLPGAAPPFAHLLRPALPARKYGAFYGSRAGSLVAVDRSHGATTMNPLHYESRGLEAIEHNGPRLLFAEHHLSLRRAAEDLMGRAHEDDCFALVAEFRTFEQQVLEHMSLEEETILPVFAEADPAEAAAIRDEHDKLRKQLERTALDVELHCIRIDSIWTLLAVLDDHAKREDQKMYPWAQVHLPASSRNTIGARLLASIQKLARVTS